MALSIVVVDLKADVVACNAAGGPRMPRVLRESGVVNAPRGLF
jgi:hypothetical protein